MRYRLTPLALSLSLVTLSAFGPGHLAAQASPPDATDQPAPQVVELEALPTPDLSALEETVRVQLESARQSVEQVSTNDPAAMLELQGLLGMSYHTYDLLEAAAVCYRNAIKLAPEDSRWPFYFGDIAERAGNLDLAADQFAQSLALDPGNVATLVRLGEVELERNRVDVAETYFDQALRRAPEEAAAKAGLGQVALSREQPEQAIEWLEAALAAVPAATRLNHPLGLAYRKLGDLDKARTHLAARGEVGVTVADPRIAELESLKSGERVNLLRGRQAFAAGHFQEAAQAFRAAADADPTSSRARVNLGTTLSRLGDVDGAVAALQEALALDDTNNTAHYNLGQLIAANDLEAGIRHLERALELDITDTEAHRALAQLYRRAGRNEDALQEFEYALRAKLPTEQAFLGYASLLVELARLPEARDALDSGVAMIPRSGRLALAYAHFLSAGPDPNLRDGETALNLAERVFQAGRTPEHAVLVAQALAELGRCSEATNWQRQAQQALTDDGKTEAAAALTPALTRYQKGPPCRPPYPSADTP